MKKGTGVSATLKNIIRLPMDANFFFERAVYSLERHRYDKALKYFRLAVEKEPDNPVNYCNLAGVLSEMGRYDESNDVLNHVLNKVDPDLVECYFYMANNAANMECYEEAEQYLLYYLQADPDGEFADEANDMLNMLAEELGRTPLSPEDVYIEAWVEEHERARQLLESGQFTRARELLKQITDDYPDCYPARNNLALAHYYLGEMETAINTARDLLEEDPGNLHALCNLAVFYHHLNDQAQVDYFLSLLKKCIPLNRDYQLKLATTLGILQEHETAYTMFRRLLKFEPDDPVLLHDTAAAAFNTERFHVAGRLWKKAATIDSQSGIPAFYLHHLSDWSRLSRSERPVISYHYYIPFEEQIRKLENEKSFVHIREQLQNDPVIRASFFWALAHGDRNTKLQVIQAFGYIGDEDVEQALRDFLLKKAEDSELKRAALFVLRNMGAKGPFVVWLNGRKLTVNTADLSQALPVWKRSWQAVVESVLKGMDENYDVIQQYDVQALWLEFLRKTYPDVPLVRKVEGWAAALEYVVGKMYGMAVSQTEIARKYGVSAATVGRHARKIETVCGVFHRFKYGIGLPFFRADGEDVE